MEYGIQRLHEAPVEPCPGTEPEEILTFHFVTFLNTMWRNRMVVRMIVSATVSDTTAVEDLKLFDAGPRERLHNLMLGFEESARIRSGTAAPASQIFASALGGFLFYCLRSEPEDWATERDRFVSHLINLVVPGLRV